MEQVEAPGEDYLGVGVEGSRVKVVWHLGGGNIGRLHLTGEGSWKHETPMIIEYEYL